MVYYIVYTFDYRSEKEFPMPTKVNKDLVRGVNYSLLAFPPHIWLAVTRNSSLRTRKGGAKENVVIHGGVSPNSSIQNIRTYMTVYTQALLKKVKNFGRKWTDIRPVSPSLDIQVSTWINNW